MLNEAIRKVVLLLIPTRLVSTIGGKQDTYEYRWPNHAHLVVLI